ncbi:hypothetical protein TNCV_4935471 [Trichonephila clavipes]|nr:hypothetical protein TNCV_4935471 [Trichonephila clavipes]
MRSMLITFRKEVESIQYPELDQALRMYRAIQNLIAEMDEGMSFLMFTSTIFNAIPMYFGITNLLRPRDFTIDSETLFIASYGAFIAMAVSGSLVGEANAKVVDQFKEMTSSRFADELRLRPQTNADVEDLITLFTRSLEFDQKNSLENSHGSNQ